jgi:DNA-binding NtrC family response regulator
VKGERVRLLESVADKIKSESETKDVTFSPFHPFTPSVSARAMEEILRLAERVAATDANVLITGESGVGKDVLAGFIHSKSKRARNDLVKIDCASLPKDLIEAELFGYERGAFTGAIESKKGRFETAHKGTLLLNEIAHLTIDAQAKLLRVIERKEFEHLGGKQTIKVDARIIALTNVDLEDAVQRKTFREDLFYRLNVVRLHVPPLRERREDIAELAKSFLNFFSEKHGRAAKKISSTALETLTNYDFFGNVRELANVIERAVIVSNSARIEKEDLPTNLQVRTKRMTLAELEEEYIKETLAFTKGNKSEAARLLGISRKNLYEKLARYDTNEDKQ